MGMAHQQNKNGLNLTESDTIEYVKFLAKEAHQANMAMGLKNAGDIIRDVLPDVEFSVNEECADTGECGIYAAFTRAGKPVFHIEYPTVTPMALNASVLDDSCRVPLKEKFSTVLKTWELDGWVGFCDGQSATTPVM
jgi:endo-alpha-1,4-polygalactosaminidase (GH114 family)